MRVLDVPIKADTLLYIALNAWVPTFSTVILGGVAASIIVPRIQRRYQRYQLRLDKKTALCEDAARAFGRYVVSWRRLRQISALEQVQALTSEEQDRKRGFVVERNARRDDLLDSLRVCKLYFCPQICSEINRFMAWDEEQAALALQDLAPLDEWRRWETQVVEALRNDIR